MRTRASCRGVIRCSVGLIAVLITALVAVPAAGAHAMLVSSRPGNDAVLVTPPNSVVLRFSEPVESAFGAVRVYDSRAGRVDAGDVERPDERTVSVGSNGGSPAGRTPSPGGCVSADAHPVSGAFVFHVESPGREPGRDRGRGARGRHAAERHRALHVRALPRLRAASAVRRRRASRSRSARSGLAGAAFGGCSRRRSRRRRCARRSSRSRGSSSRARPRAASGSARRLRWDSVSAVLETRFGGSGSHRRRSPCRRSAGAARSGDGRTAVGRSSCRLLAWLLVADAVAVGPRQRQRRPLARRRRRARRRGRRLDRRARRSLVLALVCGRRASAGRSRRGRCRASRALAVGVGRRARSSPASSTATSRCGRWRGLWETTYGQLLLAKSRSSCRCSRSAPTTTGLRCRGCAGQIASAVERARFLRMAGAELALMVAIVGVTAVLVAEPPARAQRRAAAARTRRRRARRARAEPRRRPRDGRRERDPSLPDRPHRAAGGRRRGSRLGLARRASRSGRFASRRIRLAPGHYTVHGAQLALAGDWQLRVEARRGEFEALTATVSIPIRKDR